MAKGSATSDVFGMLRYLRTFPYITPQTPPSPGMMRRGANFRDKNNFLAQDLKLFGTGLEVEVWQESNGD